MAKGKNQHVVKHERGWAVKGEGNSKPPKLPVHRHRPLKQQKTLPDINSQTPKFMVWMVRSAPATAMEMIHARLRIEVRHPKLQHKNGVLAELTH